MDRSACLAILQTASGEADVRFDQCALKFQSSDPANLKSRTMKLGGCANALSRKPLAQPSEYTRPTERILLPEYAVVGGFASI
jgi:hypothetical protein